MKYTLIGVTLLAIWFLASAQARANDKFPLMSYQEGDELTIERPLTRSDREAAKKAKFLYINPGAPPDVFRKPVIFKRLAVVSLAALDNEPYLSELAKNYQRVLGISIAQSRALSADSIALLARFRELQSLDLNCPVQGGQVSLDKLPPHLDSLSVTNTVIAGKLGELTQLGLYGGKLEYYLRSSDLPNLEHINLFAVSFDKASAESLRKFSRLKYIVSSGIFGDQQRQELSSVTKAKLLDSASPVGSPGKLPSPLRPLLPLSTQ
jgi:hypothetical protein